MATIKLSPEDQQLVKRCQRRCVDTLEDAQKLESCGVDCQERRAILEEQLARASAILREFGPGMGEGQG